MSTGDLGNLEFRNNPDMKRTGNSMTVNAGPHTDLFSDPLKDAVNSAPLILYGLVGTPCIVSAVVSPKFGSTFDAGFLVVVSDTDWSKLCFELSPQKEHSIVSVVTRGGVSDDANHAVIKDKAVHLRVALEEKRIAFHYSTNGKLWHLVRVFPNTGEGMIQIGFGSQSPTGQGCLTKFDSIEYKEGSLKDLRDGH